jgi:transcriptional regulator with XRE-family HTH domain
MWIKYASISTINSLVEKEGSGMTLGFRIIEARKRKRISQVFLAEMLGVHETSIRRWEQGKGEPRPSDIKKLCEILGVSEAELLNGPAKNELKIEFVWEVEDVDVMNIESNKFNFGFRGNDVLLWGAMPDDEDDESVAAAIVRQIRAARIGKKATNEALKKLEG